MVVATPDMSTKTDMGIHSFPLNKHLLTPFIIFNKFLKNNNACYWKILYFNLIFKYLANTWKQEK